MIRNLIEADLVARFGLVAGAFALWAAVFLALDSVGVLSGRILVAVPVILTATLFGFRGAIAGYLLGVVAYYSLSVVAGISSWGELANNASPVNLLVLLGLSMLAAYVRFNARRNGASAADIARQRRALVQERVLQARDVELGNIASEFNSSAHKSLAVVDVSLCAAAHISRALTPDYLGIAVTDLENRRTTVEQAIGVRMLGFAVGDVRSITEVLNDSVSEGDYVVLSGDTLAEAPGESHFVATAIEAGIRSVLTANLWNDDRELVAQVWIGSFTEDHYSEFEIGFFEQISDHFKSAVVNARNSESLKSLQQYLVGQNELFAQMQDGVESTEGRLRLGHEQLNALNDSKTRFMSEVAHEIKSPLAVMIGYADFLRFDTDNVGEDQRAYASSIEKSARQLTVLIDDLSDITNIETGHFSMSKETHDVVAVVASVVEGLKVSDSEFERRLIYSDGEQGFDVDGDPARLSQVFTNLIRNGLKYSSEDQPVEISSQAADDRIQISIKDHGLGISRSDIQKLFTPYFRSTSRDIREQPGTGLGLFLSKSIVDEHGGTLTVSSRLGIGSTFTVEFLRVVEEQDLEAA
jgi:signal transduction histidine kinase